jgi:hypothetical protein
MTASPTILIWLHKKRVIWRYPSPLVLHPPFLPHFHSTSPPPPLTTESPLLLLLLLLLLNSHTRLIQPSHHKQSTHAHCLSPFLDPQRLYSLLKPQTTPPILKNNDFLQTPICDVLFCSVNVLCAEHPNTRSSTPKRNRKIFSAGRHAVLLLARIHGNDVCEKIENVNVDAKCGTMRKIAMAGLSGVFLVPVAENL